MRDSLTGNSSADTFCWRSLSDSLLSAYDTGTYYEAVDRISDTGKYYGSSITSLRGPATALNATAISTSLCGTGFAAHTAQAFSVSGNSCGCFLSLNDGVAGFQSGADAIIVLQGFTTNVGNPITVV